jgi:hypothetical protein
MLRRIFGLMERNRKEEKMRNDELHNLYSLPNIIRMTKSRRMTWAKHVARIGEMKMHTNFFMENVK